MPLFQRPLDLGVDVEGAFLFEVAVFSEELPWAAADSAMPFKLSESLSCSVTLEKKGTLFGEDHV